MNSPIEEHLPGASRGEKAAIERFMQALLTGVVYVPDRRQKAPLTHSPTYPNELTSMLGISDKERVLIPVFTSPEYIEEWFGNELSFKEHPVKSLLGITPEDWWLIINPGQEISKEISPWEVTRLKEGEKGIKEIVDEISSDDSVVQSIETKPLEPGQFTELAGKLTDYAKNEDSIKKLYILLEVSLTTESEKLEKILVGIESVAGTNELEKIKEKAGQICSLNLIGNLDYKVVAGSEGSIIMGVFKSSEVVYQKDSPGLLRRIFGLS